MFNKIIGHSLYPHHQCMHTHISTHSFQACFLHTDHSFHGHSYSEVASQAGIVPDKKATCCIRGLGTWPPRDPVSLQWLPETDQAT